MRRRTFLGGGLVAGVAGTAASCAPGKTGSAWRFFTAMEARTVDAICERIIPADRDPGATEARVVHYIDIQLTGHFRKYQAAYRQGIARVDATSRKSFGKPFVELPSEGRVEVLTGMEDNGDEFFDLILTHARQGFYGDPRHGGNHNMVSWKMVGLPFPPVRGRAHYDDQSKPG
jgi:gluconate 2-dehydrogenase gamma chain